MKAHEQFQKMLRKIEGTFEYELEWLLWDLTEQIVSYMNQEGISQTELAERLDVSSARVTKLLKGHPNMTLKTILKVARALHCEVALSLRTKHVLTVHQGNGTPEFRKFNRALTLPSLSYEYTSDVAA